MGYVLGIDLGTTYTAVATYRDGRAQIVSIGTRTAAIPSVVFLRQDQAVLTGEAADRRALSEPARVAREFKRRVGDTTPIMVGGSPYSAEQLSAELLKAVVERVTQLEGQRPDHVAVCHPANWGPYKKELLDQTVALADIGTPTFVTEPEAAAIHYASTEHVAPGEIVAVYDLGGGTFDAAVLRKTETGFETLGEPQGVERLGGIDFDAAVFAHVRNAVGGALDDLDENDPTVIAAAARLREECIEAKEALSSDTETSIPVLLPNVMTEVRLTRGEFESMIRPTLNNSIVALQRACGRPTCSPPTSAGCCSSAGRRASRWSPSWSEPSSDARSPSTRTPSTRSRSVLPSPRPPRWSARRRRRWRPPRRWWPRPRSRSSRALSPLRPRRRRPRPVGRPIRPGATSTATGTVRTGPTTCPMRASSRPIRCNPPLTRWRRHRPLRRRRPHRSRPPVDAAHGFP